MLDYRGGKTTLCAGCGHNAISERIIDAFYEMGIAPERVIKMSGIGCSSKSPAYFMSRSHSFNSVHGRMPSVTTGAVLANSKIVALGVSGDGDTASIGIGQFVHLMRRNLPIIYIIEDNGVYGLTKGQFSATADLGSKLKTGVINDLPPIDTCALAIMLGATFVGRSFSGDKKQLHTMLKAALAHRGTVMLDVISPCVTFNDHEGSTKSYKFVKDHEEPLHDLNFVPHFDEIDVEYDAGTSINVAMHDGSSLRLRKLEHDYDPTHKSGSRQAADGVTRGGRGADRRALREHHRAQLPRHAQHDRRAAGHLARERNPSLARGAGRVHGSAAVRSSISAVSRQPSAVSRQLRLVLLRAVIPTEDFSPSGGICGSACAFSPHLTTRT